MSIEVIGTRSAASLVLSAILDYDVLCKEGVAATLNGETNTYTFELQSKYYTAELQLLLNVCADNSSEALKSLVHTTAEPHPIEGLIYVTDGALLSEVTKTALVRETNGLPDLNVKLLVSLKLDNSPELSDAERLSRLEWSLDHNFEHIEIDVNNLVEGWQEREKEGLPRWVESSFTTPTIIIYSHKTFHSNTS